MRQRKKWHSPLVGALALAVAAGPVLASPAMYFDYDLDRGRTAFLNTAGSTTGTPEIWQFDFTDNSGAFDLGGGVYSVTGDQGTQVWARLSGPDYGGAFNPNASGITSGGVSGGTWDNIVDRGLRVELFSDAALTTAFQFNGIGIETDDWGTCCKGLNTNADNTQTAGTAVYVVFDPTANPSGSSDPDILLVGNIDATTNRTGGLPTDPDAFAGLLANGSTNTNGHFVAAINDTAFFDDVTVAPNGAGEGLGLGGIMYLARVALGSVPAGSSAVAFGTTVASASSTPDPVGNMSVMERVLAQIDNATNLAQVNGTYVNIAENLGGTDGSGIDGSINNIVNGITESTMLARVGALSAVESILPTLDFGSMSTTTLGAVNTGEISLGVNQAADEAKTTATGAYAAVVDQIGGSADTGALVLNIASNMTGTNGSINNTMTGVNGSIGNMSTTTLGAVNTGSMTSGIGTAVQGIVGLSGTNG